MYLPTWFIQLHFHFTISITRHQVKGLKLLCLFSSPFISQFRFLPLVTTQSTHTRVNCGSPQCWRWLQDNSQVKPSLVPKSSRALILLPRYLCILSSQSVPDNGRIPFVYLSMCSELSYHTRKAVKTVATKVKIGKPPSCLLAYIHVINLR